MRIPVAWLNECVPNNLSARELAYTLTDVGLEVEAVEQAADTAVLDITVTPNRGDCLSVLGVARELAMALQVEVRQTLPTIVESGPPALSLATILLDDPDLCPRYSARIVRNVEVAPSPSWAQRRLELCGLRPINNIVDATNLVLLELGQPLHAFDYQLLRCPPGESVPEIIVRRAQPGERLVTIDGVERTLAPETLLIADPSGPIALAGIMGGATTEIHSGTTEVLLESAHFDPLTVRRGARALDISTEASFRFERTVDPGGTVRALDRACELIAEFCSPSVEIASGVLDSYPRPVAEAEITLRPSRANALLGLALSPSEMAALLRWLDLTVDEGEVLSVRVPTFRQDLKREIDLIEEVARAYGYDKIPETLPAATRGVGGLCPELALERKIRSLLRGMGLSEAVTSSLESPDDLPRVGLPEDHPLRQALLVGNPKSEDRSQLRTTSLTSLLTVIAHNRRHGVDDVAVFDLGRVYLAREPNTLPHESQHLGLACTGIMDRGRWTAPRGSETWDFYALKGVVENILLSVARTPSEFEPESHPALSPTRAARISLGSDTIGFLGEVQPEVLPAYDLPDPVFVAELDLELLREHAGGEQQYQPISRFPSVTRDIAFLLPRDLPAKRAQSVILEAAGDDLESLALFDAYQGPPLPEGQRNLAFSLTFRRADRTLTDDEVDQAMQRIRAALRDQLDAHLRE
jgi:phenylalanyl-tRNA synthetase beta chain